MLGAIAGDIIGSVFEHRPIKSTGFDLFDARSRITDDTVLTVATAHAILYGEDYAKAYHAYGNRYPDAGYGRSFRQWLASDGLRPYGSWGNGSAMRVSPIGLAAVTVDDAIIRATASASATHDHPAGIRGAQAVACAVLQARTGESKDGIRDRLEELFGYDLSRPLDEIRSSYSFDVSCDGSVPQAIRCFLEATDFEHAIRLAISLGGDADTQAAIAGGIAEAYFGEVPPRIAEQALARLPRELRNTVDEFMRAHPMR